jgi:hypothetical protein
MREITTSALQRKYSQTVLSFRIRFVCVIILILGHVHFELFKIFTHIWTNAKRCSNHSCLQNSQLKSHNSFTLLFHINFPWPCSTLQAPLQLHICHFAMICIKSGAFLCGGMQRHAIFTSVPLIKGSVWQMGLKLCILLREYRHFFLKKD